MKVLLGKIFNFFKELFGTDIHIENKSKKVVNKVKKNKDCIVMINNEGDSNDEKGNNKE